VVLATGNHSGDGAALPGEGLGFVAAVADQTRTRLPVTDVVAVQ
jgi:hypothetical protein